ncbi:MAG: helix-hairpin-helix domain-containing protein [Variovorax sp.]
MFKKILAVSAMLFAAAAFAAVDVNKGSAADLDGLKGVGPTMSKRILDARQKGEFKDWGDFMERVKGVKEKTAAKLSAEGLTVNGKAFTAPAATPKGPVAKTAAGAAK